MNEDDHDKCDYPECPACGNTDPELIEDNGCNRSSTSYTLLCMAPITANGIPGAGGVCGEQWEPND